MFRRFRKLEFGDRRAQQYHAEGRGAEYQSEPQSLTALLFIASERASGGCDQLQLRNNTEDTHTKLEDKIEDAILKRDPGKEQVKEVVGVQIEKD